MSSGISDLPKVGIPHSMHARALREASSLQFIENPFTLRLPVAVLIVDPRSLWVNLNVAVVVFLSV